MARILVVDDEEPIRRLWKQVLEDEGHMVITANDGHDGLVKSILFIEQLDLVVTDLNMLSLNGLEMIVAMQAARCLPPRAIIASGDFTNESIIDSNSRLIRKLFPPSTKLDLQFLAKPIKLDLFLQVVNTLLAGKVE